MSSHTPSGSQLEITDRISIPLAEFRFEYMRASGPGGQNVNKVSSKVRLRWNVVESPSVDPGVKQRIKENYRSRLNSDGEFLVTSQKTRDREVNREDCLEKLAEMIRQVASPPRRRRKTRPTRASKERRLKGKKQRSQQKRLRRKPRRDG